MSSLYINRLTTVDCGLLLGKENPQLVGFSFNVSVKVRGDLDPAESVIVDFGKLKKQLKARIDSLEDGYDHKLIVPKFSDVSYGLDLVTKGSRFRIIAEPTGLEVANVSSDSIRIVQTHQLTNCLYQTNSDEFLKEILELPHNFFEGRGEKIVKLLEALEEEFKHYLQQVVSELYSDLNVIVEEVLCDIESTSAVGSRKVSSNKCRHADRFFTYSHGLKDSTSLGCQNIGHGHLSYISLETDLTVQNRIEAIRIVEKIAQELNGCHFIYADNFQEGAVNYVSKDRGKYSLEVATENSLVSKIVGCETETTIENLVSFIVNKYKDDLAKLTQPYTLYVSEGLHKGSYYKSP